MLEMFFRNKFRIGLRKRHGIDKNNNVDVKIVSFLWHNYVFDLNCSSSPTCTIPKGIPFLSERSKHRVEAADNAGDDDGRKLERLLIGEGAFEDILREVSLL